MTAGLAHPPLLHHTPAPATTLSAPLVGWLSLAQLVGWGSVFYAFSMLMEPVERELGLDRASASLAFSLALLVEGAMAYPVGRWIDAGLERRVMAGGSGLAGALLLALSFVDSAAGWLTVWCGLGAAMAATLYTPAFAVLTRRHPDNFRRPIITLTFLGGLASTVFIPLMAWLLQAVGWRHMLWVLAGLQWTVCLPIHWYSLRATPRNTPLQAAAGAPAPHQTPGLSQALRQPTFALVGTFVVLMMAVTVALAAHMVNLLTESGLPTHWAVLLPAAIGMVQVVGRSLLFFFEHRAGVHQVNRWAPALLPAGLLALLVTLALAPARPQAALAMALLFVVLYGLGNGMLTIVKGTAIAQYVSQKHAASLNGALGLPTAGARAAAPWLLGALWSPGSGYSLGLWMLLGCSLVALAALRGAQHLAKT